MSQRSVVIKRVILLLAGGGALVLGVLMLSWGRGIGVDGEVEEGAVRIVPEQPNQRSVAIERVPIESLDCILMIRSESGAELGGVVLLDANSSPLPPALTEANFAKSDRSGMMRIAVDRLPEEARPVLWKHGFCPLLLPPLQSGERTEVEMKVAAKLLVRVRDMEGYPVAGYCVALALALPAGVQRDPKSNLELRFDEEGGNQFVGESDADGNIYVMGLSPGHYYMRKNLGSIAVCTVAAPVAVRIPGPDIEIKVDEYRAIVVRYIGDEVVTSSHPHVGENAPFRGFGSSLERASILDEQRDLEKKFPDAIVAVGRPRKSVDVAQMAVFGRRSGYRVHNVKLRPISRILDPEEVTLSPGAEDLTGILRVVPQMVDGGLSSRLDGVQVAILDFKRRKFATTFIIDCYKDTRVPEGDWNIGPTIEWPSEAFVPFTVEVRAGSRTDAPIRMGRLFRYRVRPRLKGGSIPFSWGLRLKADKNCSVGRLAQEFVFYSKHREVPYTLFIQGYRPRKGTLVHEDGRLVSPGYREFDLEMTVLEKLEIR